METMDLINFANLVTQVQRKIEYRSSIVLNVLYIMAMVFTYLYRYRKLFTLGYIYIYIGYIYRAYKYIDNFANIK